MSQKNEKRLSNSIRQAINNLQIEDELQKRITGRILGAAAQISENHDHLIGEVVEISRSDLDKIEVLRAAQPSSENLSPESLKKRFKTLNQAKSHFDLKAKSWSALAEKLNANYIKTEEKKSQLQQADESARLTRIEQKLDRLQADLSAVITIVSGLVNSSNKTL